MGFNEAGEENAAVHNTVGGYAGGEGLNFHTEIRDPLEDDRPPMRVLLLVIFIYTYSRELKTDSSPYFIQ